jgi:hypothetical protein
MANRQKDAALAEAAEAKAEAADAFETYQRESQRLFETYLRESERLYEIAREKASLADMKEEVAAEAEQEEARVEEEHKKVRRECDNECKVKKDAMFFLHTGDDQTILPFAVLSLADVKELLGFTSWKDLTRLSVVQCTELLHALTNLGLEHNKEFQELYARTLYAWLASSTLKTVFGETPTIYTARMTTRAGLKESSAELTRRIAFYLGIAIPSSDSANPSNHSLAYDSPPPPDAKRMRHSEAPSSRGSHLDGRGVAGINPDWPFIDPSFG